MTAAPGYTSVVHDPLEDWAEKDRLLAEIGVEPVPSRVEPEPAPTLPPPPPPPTSVVGPSRRVRRNAPEPVRVAAAPPPRRRGVAFVRRHAVAAVGILGVGIVWLAAGAGAGSFLACAVGLGFLSLGTIAALLLNKA
jgi:hypothetical protein